MKKLLPIIILFFLISCEKSDDISKFKINPMAKVYVKPKTDNAKSATKALNPLEVVKKATVLNFYNSRLSDGYCTATWVGKDTVNETPALLRWGTDIIYDTTGYGDYGIQTDFIYGYDMVICGGTYPNYDTIAYIPNKNITSARMQILEAFRVRDTLAIYTAFKNAFRFVPITGTGWQELKTHGLN